MQRSGNDRRLSLTKVEARPGAYALLLSSATEAVIPIGRLGNLRLQPGFYVYFGSALGPGGVRARLAHHMRRSHRPHWHIDYLKLHTTLEQVWFYYGQKRQEHRWAGRCSQLPGAVAPMAGFGSSDCDCESHLFFFASSHLINSGTGLFGRAPALQKQLFYEPCSALLTKSRNCYCADR